MEIMDSRRSNRFHFVIRNSKRKERQFIIKLIKNDTSSYKNHNLFSELSPGDLVPDHHIHYSTLFHKNHFC